jgi:CheY-like chemotaxis protein
VGFIVVVEVAERCSSIRASCTDGIVVNDLESDPSWSNKRSRVIRSLLILPVSAGQVLLHHGYDGTEEVTSRTCESLLHHDGPLRALVVDDAVTNRKLLARLLERRGHSCDQAKDGQEAVQKVMESLQNGSPYDTILMDYEMPVMDGPTASKEIRALSCDSLIVGVTGNALQEDIAHFKSCGANAVLIKPLQTEALEEILVEFGITL